MSHMKSLFQLSILALFWALMATGNAAAAEEGANHKTAGGLSIYLGVLPAAMIQGAHPPDHPEAEMHDGIPSGRHAYHITAALFDVETGERVEKAEIDASVAPLGLSATSRRLEPMEIADTVTFGNYFTMRRDGEYQIALSITPEDADEPVTVEFSYIHRN